MEKEQFEELIDIIESADFTPRSYGGRGMMGRQCLGIVCPDPMNCLMQLIRVMTEQFDGDDDACDKIRGFIDELENPSQDSMGMDAIIYWPGIDWQGEWTLSFIGQESTGQ